MQFKLKNKTAPILNKTAPMLNKTAPLLNKTAPMLNKAATILHKTVVQVYIVRNVTLNYLPNNHTIVINVFVVV